MRALLQVIEGLFLAPPLPEVVAVVAVFEVPVHTDPSSCTAEDSEFCKDISTEFPEPERGLHRGGDATKSRCRWM